MLQIIRIDMGMEMIDCQQRYVQHHAQSFRGCHTDKQGANETRRIDNGDCIDFCKLYFRITQGVVNDTNDRLQMSPTGNFRNHASKLAM